MIKRVIFGMFFLFVFTATPGGADENESKKLISAYILAVKSKDVVAKKKAWENLNDHPEAVEYMKKHGRNVYRAYRADGLAAKANQLRQNYEGASEIEPSSVFAPASGRKRESNSVTNRDQAIRNSNSDRIRKGGDNRDRALNRPNQDRIDNRTVVQNNPNQKRQSLQKRIRSRVRSMFD